MKRILILLAVATACLSTMAQRVTDRVDRGLIALPVASGTGNLVSWRVLAEEYYDVTYNVYRDGSMIASNLTASNYTDKGGSNGSSYSVAAVVRGKEQSQCKSVQAWNKKYKEITLAHEGIRSTLVPNDACCADVDGDGELEILMKFDNADEINQSFPRLGPVVDGKATGEYSIFEVFKLDGTRLWWVNCGPNMGDFQNNEQNIVAYDWDGDGKAEAVMRAADGTVIHMADGTTYTVGNASINYRGATGGGANWFMHDGAEYLVYMNGQTGKPYQCVTYPLARLESGESDLNKAWGDGYGHRSSKHFFGAPYLDGKHPSIFLARGIYTRHKMIAYDVDPASHKLIERWRWYNNTNGVWKGQGYHNYGIADVDMDGRDEIVFGSMVIDDNGKGLSTTGFGHGDAQHCSDFNPYAHGLEIFACNEDRQGYNYRDATTSKVYKAMLGVGKDVGRSMMGNFSDSYPGSIGSAYGDPISSVTNDVVDGMTATGINTNFRIYWDGDLCSETFNYINGKNTEGCVAKYGSWSPIYTMEGSMTNNDTKGTPCYQGDILGDWREEVIMRTADNKVRIYSTPVSTTYRIPTLWSDHQYRNAMVWQMCGYNQPPHISYFLGKMEGITQAPPPLTLTDRVEVGNGQTIGHEYDDKHVIVCENANTEINLAEGIKPYILTFNVPTWVQGTAGSEATATSPKINRITYTCNVTGGAVDGNARIVKQGDGILNLPKVDMTYTGETNIWGGVLNFDGTLRNAPLWLNRFAELNSNGGVFRKIKADYGSKIRPGGDGVKGTITADTLSLGFGSRIILDLFSEDVTADQINVGNLIIEVKNTTPWVLAGPQYLNPVIEITSHLKQGENTMTPGKYIIGNVTSLKGELKNILVEGLSTAKKKLYIENGNLILEIVGLRDPDTVTWKGDKSSNWDLAESENFSIKEEADSASTVFVSGDKVLFDDNAVSKTVTVNENVVPDTIIVDNTSAYTFNGSGSISGGASLVKKGTGTLTMEGCNSYTGGNYLKGGIVKVSSLSNQYSETGNLGAMTTTAAKFTMENGAVLQTTAAVQMGSPMKMIGEEGGVINNSADFKMDKSISGTLLTKKGSGCLYLNTSNSGLTKLVMAQGTMALAGGAQPKNIELQSGTLWDDAQNTSHGIYVPKGKSATWQLSGTYYTAYANKLTGEGTLTIVPRNTVSRVRITGDWSSFYGTVKHTNTNIWLPLDMSTSAPHATVNIASGCSVANVPGRSLTIGAVTGQGNLVNSGCDFKSSNAVSGVATWNIGNSDDKDFTFEGAINNNSSSNTCAFNKVGSCTMTVKGAWGLTGAVVVKEGTLKVTGNNVCLGTGKLTVNSGATLTGNGNGVLKNSSVIVNGVLRPNLTASSGLGKIVFNKQNVTINSTGKLQLNIAKKSTSATTLSGDNVKEIGKLTINGTIELNMLYEPSVGDELRLWTGVASFEGVPTIVCSKPFVTFDTSRLSEGVLVVKSVRAPSDVNGDGVVDVSDINAVISVITGNGEAQRDAADVNADGTVDVSDINAIISVICQ